MSDSIKKQEAPATALALAKGLREMADLLEVNQMDRTDFWDALARLGMVPSESEMARAEQVLWAADSEAQS